MKKEFVFLLLIYFFFITKEKGFCSNVLYEGFTSFKIRIATEEDDVIKDSRTLDCALTYLTTIEGFHVWQHNASGAILFRAKMAIDADGCPRAYGPNDTGLDWTANAGYPGNWWGIVTDVYGDPVIQGPDDPYPGMYVSTTSLVCAGYADTDPNRYVDSENIPFIALPSPVQSLGNISKGDLAYVRNTLNGNTSYAYFADTGPAGKLGEGSMFLADRLGINSNPRTGGISGAVVDYIVFPQSGFGQGVCLSVEEIDSLTAIVLEDAGGAGLPDCIDEHLTLNCNNPVWLTCGELFAGTSSAAPSFVSSYGCNSWTETGPERVHAVIPPADGAVTATLSDYSGDLDVYILASCDPDDCVGTVTSEQAVYQDAVAGHTYYIIVDADDGSGSAYNLVVTCPESTGVHIENSSMSGVKIFSTLKDGIVSIHAGGAGVEIISVYNIAGTRIAVEKTGSNRMDISYLSAGIYFIRVMVDESQPVTLKIVKN
ncbi:MAG: T9SS type A sorting domain-containing protein [Bacteroidetes bacterium]|nr:T9SS type A sorting domain-containing protein [Bacteroidota bacterium]